MLTHAAAILLLFAIRVLAREEKPVGRGDVEVLTTDSVPLSGTFHFLAVDQANSPRFVYVADTQRHVLRRKDVQTGTWSVIAGQDGKAGAADGAPGMALLNRPTSLCVNPQGAVLFADGGNACLRQVDPAGMVTTVAGQCGRAGDQDGSGQEALFSPTIKSLVCLANCSVLVGDAGTGTLRAVVVRDPSCLAAAAHQAAQHQPRVPTRSLVLSALCGALVAGTAWVLAEVKRHREQRARLLEGYDRLSPVGGLVVPAQRVPAERRVINVSP